MTRSYCKRSLDKNERNIEKKAQKHQYIENLYPYLATLPYGKRNREKRTKRAKTSNCPRKTG